MDRSIDPAPPEAEPKGPAIQAVDFMVFSCLSMWNKWSNMVKYGEISWLHLNISHMYGNSW